jgi:tetratricopeptide (TPR) repeat protein
MNALELLGFRATVLKLLNYGKRDTAWELLEHFFDKSTTLAEFDAIGELALKTEHRQLHLKCAETAHGIALTSDEKRASRYNLINAYNMMNYPEKAVYYAELQLKQTPEDYKSLCQKAANMSLMGNKEEGEKLLDELLVKFPDKHKELQSMLSGRYLRNGELARGVSAFTEAIKGKNELFDVQLNMKRWDGIPRPGRTVYVDGEGGIGDEIINIRFFNRIRNLGMRPILCSPNNVFHKEKNALFIRNGFEVLTESFSINQRELWTPMMGLPATLSLTEEDLWCGPYLTPLRKNRIESKKFKIGIKCSGNPYFAQDEYRKIPIDLMLSHLPEEAELYYIDKLKVNHPRVTDLADEINSWEDTLDIIDSMDCIVSSCTSLVHASGAIGKTTFVAVPIAEYYIWTTSRRDHSTPWYGDNFYVMKQTKMRDWTIPLNKINKQLLNLIGNNRD